MTDEHDHCDCEDAGDLLMAHLSGVELAPCPVHRPERDEASQLGTPLNSDRLIAGLGTHTTTL